MNDEYWSPYRPQDDLSLAPPLRTGDVEFLLYDDPGESFLVSPTIEQNECAPLHMQALTIEGRY